MIYSAVKRFEFCYAHRLLDYEGKCARLHGHNAIVQVHLAAPSTDAIGFVRDFGEIKRELKGFVDDRLDHRTILRTDDPLVAALRDLGESPFVMDCNPTAENLARLIFDRARSIWQEVASVRLWETSNSFAEFSLADVEAPSSQMDELPVPQFATR